MQQPKITAFVLEKRTTVAIYTKKQKSTVLTSALGGATLIIAQDFRSRSSAEAFNLMHYRGRSNFLFCYGDKRYSVDYGYRMRKLLRQEKACNFRPYCSVISLTCPVFVELWYFHLRVSILLRVFCYKCLHKFLYIPIHF